MEYTGKLKSVIATVDMDRFKTAPGTLPQSDAVRRPPGSFS